MMGLASAKQFSRLQVTVELMRNAAFLSLIILVTFNASAAAQSSDQAVAVKECSGRIYEPKEVTVRPKFGQRPPPSLTPEAIEHNVRGLVILSAVLCRNGRVTDIQVIKGLPFGITEKAIEAARQINFTPAEKDGETVSEVIRLEYEFHYLGEKGPPAQQPIAGRMIEDVEFWRHGPANRTTRRKSPLICNHYLRWVCSIQRKPKSAWTKASEGASGLSLNWLNISPNSFLRTHVSVCS